MRSSTWVLATTIAFLLACGGAGSGTDGVGAALSAGPSHGSVAYTKYEAGSTRYRFKTDDKVTKTWRNMSGGAVEGTYTHKGDLVTITWDPVHTNHGAREAQLRQLDDCSLAEFWWKDADGVVHDDDSSVFQRTEPKCPRK